MNRHKNNDEYNAKIIKCAKEIVEACGMRLDGGSSREKKPIGMDTLETLTSLGLMPRRRQQLSQSQESQLSDKKGGAKQLSKKAQAAQEKEKAEEL